MKIDIVTPFFYPIVGGAEVYGYELSTRLAKRGYTVTVHTSIYDLNGNKFKNYEIINNVKVLRYKPLFKKYYYYWFWLPKIYYTDIIHIIGYGHMCSALTVWRYQKRFPLVMTTIGVSAPISGPCSAWLRQQFDKIFGINQLKKLKKIIVIAEEEKNWCLKNGVQKEKINYIPVGIPDEAFGNYSTGEVVEEKFGIKKPYIVYLGRIHPQKGLKDLLIAFSVIAKNFPKVTLILAGPDNNFWNKLHKLVRDLSIVERVKYLSYVSTEDKYKLLSGCEFLLLPSKYELQGIVLVEAMAQGKPVIATNVGGIPDFVKDGENGFIVEYGDVKNLAKKIEKLLTDKNTYLRLSTNAKITAEKFRWEKIIDEYEEIYKEVLNKP